MSQSNIDRLGAALSGRYRIERELGAGGMATVYLAEDLKHDRKVAIKVLKPELAAVLGAERFVVEIKTTAAMSHPHILPLFDSGTADGFLFYVMPYLQGETIREKLNRETQFGIEDAVKVASDVAEALDYAHQHGVIHRDIKPENILLHAGRPMVMDFGIALAVSAAAGGRMTETGLSLGTPHYMSPEQATADKQITARSDLYSLASVLYEMLTGEPPHMGNSAQQIVMKIIAEPVKPVSDLRKSVPTNVVAALAKALEKLPADRFASAKEFADALRNPGFVTAHISGAAAFAGRAAPKRITLILGAVAAVMTLVAGWLATRGQEAPEDQVVRMALDLPERSHIFVTGPGQNIVAISPQGDRVAYVAQDSAGFATYVRRLDETTARRVFDRGTGDLAFSPDGQWLAMSFQSEILKVPADGGSPVSLTRSLGLTTRGLAWLNGDTILVGSVQGGLRAIPAGGGTLRLVAGSDSTVPAAFPLVLPDGKTIFWASGLNGLRTLAMLAPGESRFTDLRISTTAPLDYRDGRLIHVAPGGTLTGFPINLRMRQALGEGTQLAAGVRVSGAGTPFAALSASGTLIYVTGEANGRLMVADGAKPLTPLLDDIRTFRNPRFSPDGRKVAVGITTGASSDIWIYDRNDRTLQRLTSLGDAYVPEWSPDGKQILYRVTREGGNEIWMQPSDGSGKAEALHRGEPMNEALISPDAKWLILRTSPQSKLIRDIYVRLLSGDTTLTLLAGGPAQESHPRLSPDGRWLAYQSNEASDFQVYLRPFPNDGGRTQVSIAGGTEPLWSRSGNLLYYRAPEGFVAVTVSTSPTFAMRERRTVLVGEFASDLSHQNWDVSPDGKFVVVQSIGGEAKAVLVHNWARELREKFATGKK